MRCYLVTATDDGETVATRYASTAADSKTTRDDLIEKFGVAKKNVEIEQVEVPLDKAGLLEYLNELVAKNDKPADEEVD